MRGALVIVFPKNFASSISSVKRIGALLFKAIPPGITIEFFLKI